MEIVCFYIYRYTVIIKTKTVLIQKYANANLELHFFQEEFTSPETPPPPASAPSDPPVGGMIAGGSTSSSSSTSSGGNEQVSEHLSSVVDVAFLAHRHKQMKDRPSPPALWPWQ
ncbi:hypothetical protein Avbf_00231 [Armadillidium vulgare]|nr:hypothetical protein Avbf_00231 [Armadillidium vulgare]